MYSKLKLNTTFALIPCNKKAQPLVISEEMPKKSTSSSNVPNSNSSTGVKVKSSLQKTGSGNNTPNSYPSAGGIINSKHLHNQSHQQKVKNNRETSEQPSVTDNLLMKKLFEAVQKQKAAESSTNEKRTRKGTAPLPKTMNSSQTYAGAAFDRAPAATSFPIPSFIKTGSSESGACGPALSSSCPIPGLEAMESKQNSSNSTNLKTLSVTDLFKASVVTCKDTEEVAESSDKEQPEETKKLQNLTNDLRKLLNLR